MLQTLFFRLKKFWERFSGVEQKLLLIFILIIVIDLILLPYVSGSRIEAPKGGGTYNEGLVGQPLHINPLLAPTNDVDADLSRIIYSGLYKFDPELNLVPDLAAALPELSTDGKTYTIRLKDKLFWHDGARITADDVIFTLQAIQNPNLQSPLRFSWNRVEIVKVDELTLTITTREPSAPFIANLTVGILPKHLWEAVPDESFALSKLNLEPVGAGPFRLTEIKRGGRGNIREIVLAPHKQYHAGPAYLGKLVFKFYATTDELINAYQGRDLMGLGYVPFDQNLFIQPGKKDLQQIALPLPQYQAVFINRVKNPAPLEDVRARMALAISVDKQKIIDTVYGGNASEAYGPILPSHLGYHEQIPGAEMNIYDVERAKSLLEEAGWLMDGALGFRKDDQDRIITLQLATNNFSPNVRVAELLKEMWQAIGIQIILNIETVATLEDSFIRPRNYELLLFSENVGADPDPYPFWHSSQLRDPGLNLSTFSNRAADTLLVEARGNLLPEQRAEKYRKFQEVFVGDVPAIFLNRSVYVYNISTDIKGLELNTVVTPADRFADIEKWYIKTKRLKQ